MDKSLYNTINVDDEWSSDWSLYSMELNDFLNRPTIVSQATNKHDSNLRILSYYDQDKGEYSPWNSAKNPVESCIAPGLKITFEPKEVAPVLESDGFYYYYFNFKVQNPSLSKATVVAFSQSTDYVDCYEDPAQCFHNSSHMSAWFDDCGPPDATILPGETKCDDKWWTRRRYLKSYTSFVKYSMWYRDANGSACVIESESLALLPN